MSATRFVTSSSKLPGIRSHTGQGRRVSRSPEKFPAGKSKNRVKREAAIGDRNAILYRGARKLKA